MRIPKISIIVPIYNVEKYLVKCIESILDQSYKDFELILVNDGSLDKCGEICDEYAKKDNRIKVIHKENGGLSSARNVGLDIAKGEYIGFIDSDDFIDSDMFELLLNAIERSNSQVAIAGVKINSNNNITKKYFTDEEVILNGIEVLEYILNKKICMAVWNKLYHRDIFENIRFLNGKIHEDTFITPQIYNQDIKVIFINKEKYNYVIRSESIMGEAIKKPKCDLIEAYSQILEHLKKSYPKKVKKNIYGCIEFCLEIDKTIYYEKQWNNNKEYIEKMNKFININKWLLLNNKYIALENKLEILIFLITKNQYIVAYYLLKMKNKIVFEINRFRRES